MRTVRHYWPQLLQRLAQLPDSRFPPFVVYGREFLIWWGLLMFCFKLGSRRQLDSEMRDMETYILDNVNRLAGTRQDALPVHKTLAHFLGHVRSSSFADLRTWCIRRLIRMKALDDYRLQGRVVIGLDGTGHLRFHKRHCSTCLTQKNGDVTVYMHQVLEAKILTDSGLALSIGTEFIRNTDPPTVDTATDYESYKQDCELKAFLRMAPALKRDFPQMPLCFTADSLFGCGTAMQTFADNHWSYFVTFKPGRTPALWEDFQRRLCLEPQNVRRAKLPSGATQKFRWVCDLPHTDDIGRTHHPNAIICEETLGAVTTTYAWLTDIPVCAENVQALAAKGGRIRQTIENQGFNTQKTSDLNLEHAYGWGEDILCSFYYLLQIAHIFLQLLEKGSLLKNLALQYNKTPRQLFGSLKNIARRLLECFRCFEIPADAFDSAFAEQLKIRLDTG